MKSAIIYYSYSGHTRMVAQVLAEYLKEKGEIGLIELKAQDETDAFFFQAWRGLRHKRAKIEPVNFDLGGYDLICLGTPVWTGGPAPAINTYLDLCFGLEGKEVILFTTYGSGLGREHCLNYIQKILNKKGAQRFNRFSIQQLKVNDKEFILSEIKELMRL